MKIDAHQHFWRYDPVQHAWIDDAMAALRRDFLPSDLAPVLRQHQIDGTVLVQVDQTEAETYALLRLVQESPFVKGVVGWVDLKAPDVAERLAYFARFDALKGFRHIVQAEPDDRFMLDPAFQRGIGHLKDFGFTYDLLVYPHQLPAAIRLVATHPEQRFVLDHIAKPPIRAQVREPWASLLRTLAQHDNVWCKVSGLVTEADFDTWTPSHIFPYLDVVFEAFSENRLMFGSDWPVCRCAATYDQVLSLIENYTTGHRAEARRKLFGENAVAFYKL